MCKPSDNSAALAAFIARKTEIDTILTRLTTLSDEHFNIAPAAPPRFRPAGLDLVAGTRWSGPVPGVPTMTDKPKQPSDTARAVLTLAAARDDHLVRLPRLPTAAAQQVVRSLLNAGLAEEVATAIHFPWAGRARG